MQKTSGRGEMVDAIGLGPIGRKVMEVQVLSSALRPMKSTLQKQEDGTITLTITIPSEMVKKTREAIIEDAVKNAEIAGFRKGKAPRKLVEEQLSTEKVKEETLKKLLPDAYLQAVREYKIRPIINPQIHVQKLDDPSASSGQATDWEFTATTCEMPHVDLGDYKTAIGKVTAKSKIIIPGKEKEEPKLDDIVRALLTFVKVIIPKVLVANETERLLSQTLDEIKRLGLTLDQYLASTGKTPETLRSDYEQKAISDMKFEFALQKISEAEKIIVEEKEIDEALLKAKSEEEKKNLEANRYMLASILRQQKTLDFLKNL